MDISEDAAPVKGKFSGLGQKVIDEIPMKGKQNMSQEHEHHHHDQTTHSDKEVEGKVLKDQVCPMHPEVLPDRSGSCPKCGMALEPNGGAALEYL